MQTVQQGLIKKKRLEMSERAQKLINENIYIDNHNHMMFEFMLLLAYGEVNIFDRFFADELRRGGIDMICTSVGMDSPCVCNMTDYLEFGSFEQIQALKQDLKLSKHGRLVTSYQDIVDCYNDGKIAIMMATEGTRALEGRPGEESLVMLQTFVDLGVRMFCLSGSARTQFVDGVGEMIANAGITTYGQKIIREMNRLGCVIDLSHIPQKPYLACIEASEKPVISSHVGVQAVSPNDCNLDDEQIKAIGKNGGLIGIEMVKTDIKVGTQETGEVVTWDYAMKHIDHIANLIGPEHVCIGLDFDNYPHIHNVHRAMCPFPGSIEGFYTGIITGDHMLNDPNKLDEAYILAEYFVKHGYSDTEIINILGGNLMRFYRTVLD